MAIVQVYGQRETQIQALGRQRSLKRWDEATAARAEIDDVLRLRRV
jgi:hypothetical protein